MKGDDFMKKDTLIQIVLGTVGGVIFAFGMCMWLIPEWDLFWPGVVASAIGILILMPIYPIYRKNHPRKPIHVEKSTLVAILSGTAGCLLLGIGMSLALTQTGKMFLLLGMGIGVLGIIVLALAYPMFLYFSQKK